MQSRLEVEVMASEIACFEHPKNTRELFVPLLLRITNHRRDRAVRIRDMSLYVNTRRFLGNRCLQEAKVFDEHWAADRDIWIEPLADVTVLRCAYSALSPAMMKVLLDSRRLSMELSLNCVGSWGECVSVPWSFAMLKG